MSRLSEQAGRVALLRGQDAASHRVVEQFERVFPHGGRTVAGVLVARDDFGQGDAVFAPLFAVGEDV